jgi:hypothetical protein
MTDQPIACTLPADEVPGRLALIDALAADALLERVPIPRGVRLRFRAGAEPRVRELATLESRCCALLTFAVERSGDAVVLDVTGAPGAATRQLADAG